jgi:hypothetical protein
MTVSALPFRDATLVVHPFSILTTGVLAAIAANIAADDLFKNSLLFQ